MIRHIFIAAVLLFPDLLGAQDCSLAVQLTLEPTGLIYAESESCVGEIQRSKDKLVAERISVPAKSLKTIIDMRNQNMYEILEVKKYPNIELLNAVASGGVFTAKLKVRNHSLDVKGTYEVVVEKSGDRVVSAEFPIKLSELKFGSIDYLGIIRVNDDVLVKAKLLAP